MLGLIICKVYLFGTSAIWSLSAGSLYIQAVFRVGLTVFALTNIIKVFYYKIVERHSPPFNFDKHLCKNL